MIDDEKIESFKKSMRLYLDEAPKVKLKRKKTRSNGEGSIRKKGNGWEGRITIGTDENGKQVRKSVYGSTKKECVQKMQQLMEEAKKGTAIPTEVCPTLAQWLHIWLNEYHNNLAAMTYKRYTRLIKQISDSVIGQKKLSEILPLELQQQVNTFTSHELCARAIAMLQDAFHLAVDNGYIPRNTAASVRNNIQKPAPSFRESDKAFSLSEENRFVEAIQNNPFRILYLLSLYAGLRRGEVCALTWNDIDFEKRLITVNHAAVKSRTSGYVIGNTKTEQSLRSVPISGQLFAELSAFPKSGTFVYANKNGFLNPDILTTDFSNIMKELGMKHTLHQLRHTFATRCMEKGIKVKVVQTWMGHAKVDMTMNTYTHATEELLREELVKLG